MSYNGRKTPFTMGSSTQSPRPQPDFFARDPFKVQSYNFRYADLPGIQFRQPPYNTNNKNPIEFKNFNESRRRSFIQSGASYGNAAHMRSNTALNMSMSATKRNVIPSSPQAPPKVYADYTRPYYQAPPVANNFSTTRFESFKNQRQTSCSHLIQTTNNRKNHSYNISLPKIRGSSSLCEINIKIKKAMNGDMPSDRFIINIERENENSIFTTNKINNALMAENQEQTAIKKCDTHSNDSCDSFSSDSSTSDYDKQEDERLPQWITLTKCDNKITSPDGVRRNGGGKCNNSNISHTAPIIILGAQKYCQDKCQQLERKNSCLNQKISTQTLRNNLNIDVNKAKNLMQRNNSKSSLRLSTRNSSTNYLRKTELQFPTHSKLNLTAVAARVSSQSLRRTSSEIKTLKTPVHVNISI